MDPELALRRHETAASHEDLRRCLDILRIHIDRVAAGELVAVEVVIAEAEQPDDPGALDRLESTLFRWMTGGERLLRLDIDGLLVVLPIASRSELGTGNQVLEAAAHCSRCPVQIGVASAPNDGDLEARLIAIAQQRVALDLRDRTVNLPRPGFELR